MLHKLVIRLGRNRNPSSYTYNQVDELNAGNGYTYDMLGNMTADSARNVTYTYSADNILNTASSGASLTWNAHGQRVRLQKRIQYLVLYLRSYGKRGPLCFWQSTQ